MNNQYRSNVVNTPLFCSSSQHYEKLFESTLPKLST